MRSTPSALSERSHAARRWVGCAFRSQDPPGRVRPPLVATIRPLRSPPHAASAFHFPADKHRHQRRKDRGASPYINHPIEVATVLATVGGVTDVNTLIAAILHDTIEDTDTTADELEQKFGREVRLLVEEMTDDKTLRKAERKRLQVAHARTRSHRAKLIKLGDKICNVRDVTH